MNDIRHIAEDWFLQVVALNSCLNGKLQKPGALIDRMPKELKDLKSSDLQVPFQKEYYMNG